jgi:hypothetical protein
MGILGLNPIWPFSFFCALSVGLRLMNWKSCGISVEYNYNLIEEDYFQFVESKGNDPGTGKISSTYSLAPSNQILVRLGRIERVS